ncbi:hypothetical protein HBI71_098840 [Parastagonospora nodorum]|nr:hypothetical protein HBI71_098840 [Parastagonospora nodorum]KAH5419988.1 hypothetical protein HBI32_101890 [Parastagonospora nodorum]
MPSLPPISTLSHSPDTTITQTLDLLFEPSPALHALTLPVLRSTTFPSYDVLITAIGAQLTALISTDTQKLDEILGSHPRLGAKKVDSEQSRKEQAQLQGGEEEGKALEGLNAEYEEKFPGLRYVVFVNARPRPVIMQNMRERIDRGDIEAERTEAIQAMCAIATDRAGKLQSQT